MIYETKIIIAWGLVIAFFIYLFIIVCPSIALLLPICCTLAIMEEHVLRGSFQKLLSPLFTLSFLSTTIAIAYFHILSVLPRTNRSSALEAGLYSYYVYHTVHTGPSFQILIKKHLDIYQVPQILIKKLFETPHLVVGTKNKTEKDQL